VAAVAFLTRIPVRADIEGPDDLLRAVPWFPLVGLGIGATTGGILWLAAQGLSPLVAASLAVATGLAVTGAFHEDGLADSFDALGGGRDRTHALEIMRDSRLGTFGVAALAVVLVTRIAALAALAAPGGALPLLAVPAAAALGRGAAVAVMGVAPAARAEGLGADHLVGLGRRRRLIGVASALFLGVLLLGWAAVPAVAAGGVAAATMTWWAVRRIGGLTGDVLGAVATLAELAVLVVVGLESVQELVPW
jgi:adenosylcobinamide-GDP ribazoletransferase